MDSDGLQQFSMPMLTCPAEIHARVMKGNVAGQDWGACAAFHTAHVNSNRL